MRGLVREAGLEHEFEIDSAGTGSWHAGDAPDRRATEAAARARRDARGRRAPGPPARLRALRPAAGDGPREPARAADVLARRRRGRQGAAAARVRPGQRGRARPRRARPVLRRPGRLRDGARPGRGRLPRPARPRCGEPRGRRPRGDRPRGAGPASASAAATSTTPTACSSRTSRSRSSRPARTSRRASTRRRRPALRWLGEPGALRVPEVLGVGDDRARARLGRRGRPRRAAAFGAGLAEVHAAGADDFGARRRRGPRGARGARRQLPPLRLASLTLPNDAAPDWPTFYAERRLLPLLPHAGLTRFGNQAVESVCARMPRPRRAARAARAPARRPVERERPVGARRAARG